MNRDIYSVICEEDDFEELKPLLLTVAIPQPIKTEWLSSSI